MAAATDVARGFDQLQVVVSGEHGCGLHQDALAGADLAGHNHALGALAGVGEAPFDEELIGADACHWESLWLKEEREQVAHSRDPAGQRRYTAAVRCGERERTRIAGCA
ncbi:MAG: hypothetical protein U5Q44_14990 [Dehalococcoidia bacterium]|nr:hypothetical protein [Dehalococcoidia bacterium]